MCMLPVKTLIVNSDVRLSLGLNHKKEVGLSKQYSTTKFYYAVTVI